ncbi:MAG: TMEM175 family protein [Bacteroidota bacterium]
MKTIFSKTRVEAFSDGIFAIIVTLLVLEIKVPHIEDHASARALTDSLLKLFPKFISWIISFFTVAVIWVNHHKIIQAIQATGPWHILVELPSFTLDLLYSFSDSHNG